MKITEKLTDTLLKLATEELEKVAVEKSMAARTGAIIQALRAAVEKADLYLWNGEPYFFNGKIYVPITADEFKGCVYDMLLKADLKPADFMMLEKIQRISMQAVQSKPLKLRKDIIVFENCVLVMPELTPTDEVKVRKSKKPQPAIRKHSPELAQTTMCHFDYDPDAECERWLLFLEDVLDNLQLRMVLQEFLGCIFVDRKVVKLESMLILIGNGSNGKGVVSETIRNLIGKDSTTSYGLDSLLVGIESLHNVAKMNGMRVNWCTEIQAIQSGRFSDKLKTLISGEPVECRQMYGQPFTATDLPLMIANCNALPPLQDRSYGMQRRFIIIRFDKTIPVERQDKMLLKKLEPEYAGIFNWILEGRQRFINQHFSFTRCRAIDEAIQNYIDASNNVEEWLKIKTYAPEPKDIIETEPLSTPCATLYDEYRRWCISENIAPFTVKKFSNILVSLGFMKVRRNNGNHFKLYGEKALAELTFRKAQEMTRVLKEGGSVVDGQILRKGIIYDVGDISASKQWHISRPYMTILRNKGWLDGTFTPEIRDMPGWQNKIRKVCVNVYNHQELGRRLEEIGIYDQSDDFNKLSERRKDQVRRAREFNAEMKNAGKPFRKFVGRGAKYPRDAIFVGGDWEYTADAAELLINKKIADEEAKRRANSVKVGKAGDMRTKSKRQHLGDIMAAKIEGDKFVKDDAVDENGEPIEIDIDDDDLRISEE